MTQERRGRPRFRLQLPVLLKVFQDGEPEIPGTTENVSLTGVMLSTDIDIAVQARVKLTMAIVQPAIPPYKLRLFNSGRVVRVERRAVGNYSVAVECDWTFEHRKQYLS